MKQLTRTQLYIGERDGKRISVFVGERISAKTARSIEAARAGGPYQELDYLEEPVATSSVEYELQATSSVVTLTSTGT